MRKKRPGSITARLLWVSAAKLTTVSMSSSARSRSVVEVADVADREPHAEPVEVARVAGVGQLVQRHHVIVRMAFEPPMDEVRADEPGRAGDEIDLAMHAWCRFP